MAARRNQRRHSEPARAKTSEAGADVDHWSAIARRVYDRLERIMHLEQQLALTSLKTPLHRTLRAAVRVEAAAYRRTLDAEQAAATHGEKPST
ncbi:MAG: hypothetical protein ABJA98_25550 [Acidobacteriota bacterium]